MNKPLWHFRDEADMILNRVNVVLRISFQFCMREGV